MRPEEPTYTIGEIALATGIKSNLLSARRKQKGIPAAPRGGGYTLEQVKLMVKRPSLKRGVDPRKADQLKARLKNDGLL